MLTLWWVFHLYVAIIYVLCCIACEQALCLGKIEKIVREGEGAEPVDKPMRLLFRDIHCASDSDASSY